MFVEDLLIKIRDALLSSNLQKSNLQKPFDSLLSEEWHINFIASVSRYVEANKPLSTKQSTMILKLIEKVRPYLIKYGWASDTDLAKLLKEPQFRQPLYESTTNIPKEVRHIGDNLLAFRSKNNEVVRNKLKALCYPKLKQGHITSVSSERHSVAHVRPARFDWLYKVWIIPVYRFNVTDILDLIETERFNVDQATAAYLRLARRSFNQPSLFAVNSEIILANVCDDPILASWIIDVAGGVTL